MPNVFPVYAGGQYVLNTYGVSGNQHSPMYSVVSIKLMTDRVQQRKVTHRDVIMARTGETYLIKAEAQVRSGNFQDAISTINQLRARAEWKNGKTANTTPTVLWLS